VWVVLEGDVIVTSRAGTRQKLKNLEERPLATVFVIDPANPYRTLEVRGDVTIEPDPELAALERVPTAYGTYSASFEAPLERWLTVTLRPVHVGRSAERSDGPLIARRGSGPHPVEEFVHVVVIEPRTISGAGAGQRVVELL
jgi:hypothetical protein